MRLRTLFCLPLIIAALVGCGNEDGVELSDEPQLFVDRNSLLFDTEYGSGTWVGATTFNTLIIENRGLQELEITEVSKSGPNVFTLQLPEALANGGPLRLQSRERTFIEVAFKPTQARQYDGALIIKSNDPATPEKQVTLTGKGVTPPAE